MSEYTLYMFPFSLYSIMVRLAYEFGRGHDPSSGGGVSIKNVLINLHLDENTTEDFLTKVNPKGQVPTLTGDALPSPLTDSQDISYWLCTHYPHLLPHEHESTIRDALAQLHDNHALPLSVRAALYGKVLPCPDVDELLKRNDISPAYRRALEFKRQLHVQNDGCALLGDKVTRAEHKARTFFDHIVALRNKHGSSNTLWIFGRDPTVLDAHCIPFIVRLLDNKREDLVPRQLLEYAANVTASGEWLAVTGGRSTLWNPSVGHVKDLEPYW